MGRPSPLYVLDPNFDPNWSWTARYRLPKLQRRADVLRVIHNSVQTPTFKPREGDQDRHKGLNGVFIGPPGDNTAEIVQDVIFATDPSRRLGTRPPSASDLHALTIAREHGWQEVDENGGELLTEEAIQAYGRRTVVRVIIGLNKNRYKGGSAFTLHEVRRLLPWNTLFTLTEGGCLFSTQPGWKVPYEEPAALLQLKEGYAFELEAIGQLSELAWALNQQHRFVVETPDGALVYIINLP